MVRFSVGRSVVEVEDSGLDTVIDVRAGGPYRASVHAVRAFEHGVFHYLVVVRAERMLSAGLDYGWSRTTTTKIEHVFYGYHAEKRFKALDSQIKKMMGDK